MYFLFSQFFLILNNLRYQTLQNLICAFYEEKCKEYDSDVVSQAERVITLQSIDTHWMDHIDDMSHLREQVAFAGYAQRDPLIEYKDQGFRKFKQLLAAIDSTIVRTLLQIDFNEFAPQAVLDSALEELGDLQTNEESIEGALTQTGVGGRAPAQANPAVMQDPDASVAEEVAEAVSAPKSQERSTQKVGRNDPCPCGSGRKYKKCHGSA